MKLRVENLAKIAEAEVEVKNLTLFVGQNSTHKSYMAHVIYELYKEFSNLGSNLNWNSRNKFISSIIKNLNSSDYKYFESLKIEISEINEQEQIDEDEWIDHEWTVIKPILNKEDSTFNKKITILHHLILDEISKLINESFNVNKIILDKLFIEETKNLDYLDNNISVYFDTPREHFNEDRKQITIRIISQIIQKLLTTLFDKLDKYKDSYYFPASRTGFVLTLDEIYAGIFRDKFRGQTSATRLGEPTIDFIQTFADIKTNKNDSLNLFSSYSGNQKNNRHKDNLINFLESNIINGQIKEINNDQNYSTYYLNINGNDLDLHLASSATLETLPFIVFLKNTNKIEKTLFVIEEPEAHLHPKAQVQMAKFLVLLSNTGAKVLVTTHSDYILNEINNCIKLNTLKDKSNFSISKDNISAYLFKNEETKTTVSKLEIDKFGISNDNFDEVLNELLDNSGDLNERIEKNE